MESAPNRPILVTDPLSKTVAYTYNTLDEISTVRDPNDPVSFSLST